MPQIGQLTPLQSSQNAADTAPLIQPKTTADYDAFLNLLVAQLKNQDPTKPTDSAEYLSQLASFSSVEQQIQINDKLNSLIQSNLLGQATDIIGRTATSSDGELTGIIASVELTDAGLVANLVGGSSLPITSGVIIE